MYNEILAVYSHMCGCERFEAGVVYNKLLDILIFFGWCVVYWICLGYCVAEWLMYTRGKTSVVLDIQTLDPGEIIYICDLFLILNFSIIYFC